MMDATPAAGGGGNGPATAGMMDFLVASEDGAGDDAAAATAGDRLGTFVLTAPADPACGFPTDIGFRVVPHVGTVPPDQEALKTAIDSTLTSLRIILPPDSDDPAVTRRFGEYFNRIYSAARVGLVTPAYPEVARPDLQAVREEIVYREGPAIVNGYLKRLGTRAFLHVFAALLVHVAALIVEQIGRGLLEPFDLHNLPLMWAGAMIGGWLSVGASRRTPTLEDLARMREDSLDADMRLLFVGLLTLVVGLVLLTDLIVITVGTFDGGRIEDSWMIALLVGAFCGLGEKAMSSRIVQQAQSMFGGGGTSGTGAGTGGGAGVDGGAPVSRPATAARDGARETGAAPGR